MWGPPHDRPENSRFQTIFNKEFNSGIAASKIQFLVFGPSFQNQNPTQNSCFYCFRTPKHQFKASQKKFGFKMSQNGFRLEASDWEKMAQACFPAALQNLRAPQTGWHSAFSSQGFGVQTLQGLKGLSSGGHAAACLPISSLYTGLPRAGRARGIPQPRAWPSFTMKFGSVLGFGVAARSAPLFARCAPPTRRTPKVEPQRFIEQGKRCL